MGGAKMYFEIFLAKDNIVTLCINNQVKNTIYCEFF